MEQKKNSGFFWVIVVIILIICGTVAMTIISRERTSAIMLNENNVRIAVGESYVLSAKVIPDTAKDTSYELVSDNDEIASVQDKTVTANKAGSAVVSVYQAGKLYDQCSVTVYDIFPDRISFMHEVTEGKIGREVDLQMVFVPANVTDTGVEYAVSDAAIAEVNDGVLKFLGEGTVTVSAKHIASGISIEMTVDVTPVELETIAVAMPEQFELGSEMTLTAALTPSDTTVTELVWSSSSPYIASITDGVLKANVQGKTTIKVIDNVTKQTASLEIKVIPVEVASISIQKSREVKAGDSFELKASIHPENATNKNLTWKSSDTNVATVKNGKVTTRNAGTAIITVQSANGRTAKCTVTVSPKPVSIINGMVQRPSAYCYAPVKVNAPANESVYVYFKSSESKSYDFSMLVKAGTSCEVDAPLGSYTAYYASGTTWYGKEFKFGDGTKFYKCDSWFYFYRDENYVHGSELTLYKVSNGNMDSDPISENQFPG